MSENAITFMKELFEADLGLYVAGQARSGEGDQLELVSPSTGAVLGTVRAASNEQVDEAVAVARAAQRDSDWAQDPELRASILRRLADLTQEHATEIAYLDAVEAGKILDGSVTEDVPDVVANLRFFADLITQDSGRYLQDSGGWGWVRQVPVGVVGAVLPWNYPIAMLGWKVAPALAAGNAMVIKPSEDSTMSALYFAELATQAGLPEGLLNVLTGDGPGVGQAIGMHPDVDMVTFTGSGRAGRAFLEYSARSNLKKVSLELGGRAAYIVDADHVSDVGQVADDIIGAAFGNSGQNCTASSRVIYVGDEEGYDAFRTALASAMDGLKVGDPLTEGSTMGPVITAEAQQRILSWVDEAIDEGARVVRAIDEIPTDGHWVAPTVLEDVAPQTQLGQGEIFGPVSVLSRATSREEAVAAVNDDDYGLASTVWCEDIGMVRWWSDQIRVGTLAVNGYSEGTVATPFGGLRQSGFWGRDNGPEALAGYQESMTVWVTNS